MSGMPSDIKRKIGVSPMLDTAVNEEFISLRSHWETGKAGNRR